MVSAIEHDFAVLASPHATDEEKVVFAPRSPAPAPRKRTKSNLAPATQFAR